jgi:hypothetical protein
MMTEGSLNQENWREIKRQYIDGGSNSSDAGSPEQRKRTASIVKQVLKFCGMIQKVSGY